MTIARTAAWRVWKFMMLLYIRLTSENSSATNFNCHSTDLHACLRGPSCWATMFEGGSLRASMREESSASMREGPASMHSTRFVQAHERRVSSNCTIVFGTLQPKTEMRGKYMIFSTIFQLAWAVKTGAMALHTMRCPFISCLDLSWMYTWYISLYVLQPHPDCVHNPGVAARHIKWYHDVRECRKGFAERGAQEVSRPEPWQKACAFHFVASHFCRAICVSNTQMRVGNKLQVYIYILRSYTLIPSKARWYNILAGLCCEHARSPHLYIFFL